MEKGIKEVRKGTYNNLVLGLMLACLVIFSGCVGDYSPRNAGAISLEESYKNEFNSRGCADSTDVKFLEVNARSNKYSASCHDMRTILRSKTLSQKLMDPNVAKYWAITDKEVNSADFKNSLKAFSALEDKLSITTIYSHLDKNLKKDGTYYNSVLTDVKIPTCLDGNVLMMEYTDTGDKECFTSEEIEKQLLLGSKTVLGKFGRDVLKIKPDYSPGISSKGPSKSWVQRNCPWCDDPQSKLKELSFMDKMNDPRVLKTFATPFGSGVMLWETEQGGYEVAFTDSKGHGKDGSPQPQLVYEGLSGLQIFGNKVVNYDLGKLSEDRVRCKTYEKVDYNSGWAGEAFPKDLLGKLSKIGHDCIVQPPKRNGEVIGGSASIGIVDILECDQMNINGEWIGGDCNGGNGPTGCQVGSPNYCSNTGDPCCGGDHCLKDEDYICEISDDTTELCNLVDVCGAAAEVSGWYKTCTGASPACPSAGWQQFEGILADDDCGPYSVCGYEDPETSLDPSCKVPLQQCGQGSGSLFFQDGEDGQILGYDLRGDLKSTTDAKTGTKEYHDTRSRTNTCEDISLTGVKPDGTTKYIQMGQCACSNDHPDDWKIMSGWYHDAVAAGSGESESIFAYDQMGCENDAIAEDCGENAIPLCYLTTYTGMDDPWSSGFEDKGIAVDNMELPWTFVDQYGNGQTYTITEDDVQNSHTGYCECPEGVVPTTACDGQLLDGDGNVIDSCSMSEDTTPYWTIDFGNKHGAQNHLWEIGPCQDGEGVFCVGDGYCETACDSDENCPVFEGESLGMYESYFNSPDDCDQHYLLNFELSTMAEPHSLDALGVWWGGENECRDTDWDWDWLFFDEILNAYAWERPDNGYAFNAETSQESQCAEGFKKIYWTNYKDTYLFNGVGELFTDSDVAHISNFGDTEWASFQESDIYDVRYTDYYTNDGLELTINDQLAVPNMFGFNTYYKLKAFIAGEEDDWGGEHCGGWGSDSQSDQAHYTVMATGLNFKSLNPEGTFDLGEAGFESCNDGEAGACNLKALGVGMTWWGDENNLWYTIGIEEGSGEWEPSAWEDCGNLYSADENNEIVGPWDETCHVDIPAAFNWDGEFDYTSANLDDMSSWSPTTGEDITVYDYDSADSEWLNDMNLVNRWYCCTNNADRNRESVVLGCATEISA